MTTLVTGGAGFIGSHVVEKLINAGRSVTVIDNLEEDDSRIWHLLNNPRCSFVRADVRDFEEILAISKISRA